MAPSTSSVLWAEWRRGLKDLQNAVLDPWNGTTQRHEEPGTIANPTSAIVTRQIESDKTYEGLLSRHAERQAPEPERQAERE